MIKRLMLLFIILLMFSSHSFATDSKNRLSEWTLDIPQAENLDSIPDINISLRDKYDNALDTLTEEGLGINNFPNGLEELIPPEGFGNNANEVFRSKYGDMWTSKQINKQFANQGLNNKLSDSELNSYVKNIADKYSDQWNTTLDGEKILNIKDNENLKISNKFSKYIQDPETVYRNSKSRSFDERISIVNGIGGPEGWNTNMNSHKKSLKGFDISSVVKQGKEAASEFLKSIGESAGEAANNTKDSFSYWYDNLGKDDKEDKLDYMQRQNENREIKSERKSIFREYMQGTYGGFLGLEYQSPKDRNITKERKTAILHYMDEKGVKRTNKQEKVLNFLQEYGDELKNLHPDLFKDLPIIRNTK